MVKWLVWWWLYFRYLLYTYERAVTWNIIYHIIFDRRRYVFLLKKLRCTYFVKVRIIIQIFVGVILLYQSNCKYVKSFFSYKIYRDLTKNYHRCLKKLILGSIKKHYRKFWTIIKKLMWNVFIRCKSKNIYDTITSFLLAFLL